VRVCTDPITRAGEVSIGMSASGTQRHCAVDPLASLELEEQRPEEACPSPLRLVGRASPDLILKSDARSYPG
jgi:hypothetical protein